MKFRAKIHNISTSKSYYDIFISVNVTQETTKKKQSLLCSVSRQGLLTFFDVLCSVDLTFVTDIVSSRVPNPAIKNRQ